MSSIHTVKPGETLSRIAALHAIANWQDLYWHDENAPLRAKRPDPHRLFPGDTIRVPAQRPLPKAKIPPSTTAATPAAAHAATADPRWNEAPTRLVAEAKPVVYQLVAGAYAALCAVKPLLDNFPRTPSLTDIAALQPHSGTLGALQTHFHFNRSKHQPYLDTVIAHFRQIAGALSNYDTINTAVDMATANADNDITDFSIQHPPPAYTQSALANHKKHGCFYSPFFRPYDPAARDKAWQGQGPKTRAATILHEMFHLLCSTMWEDRSYIWQTEAACTHSPGMCRRYKRYDQLTAGEAIHNPDSHSYFAVQVVFGNDTFPPDI